MFIIFIKIQKKIPNLPLLFFFNTTHRQGVLLSENSLKKTMRVFLSL
jgi:hypothetical protein